VARKLKGSNVSVNIVSALTGLRYEFTDIKDCTVTFARDVQSEGYLGQDTEQKDDDFKGVDFSLTAHSRQARMLELLDLINQITRGISADTIQIVMSLRFPDGVKRIILPDCKFGNLEVGAGGKAEYVTFPLEGSADDYRILNA